MSKQWHCASQSSPASANATADPSREKQVSTSQKVYRGCVHVHSSYSDGAGSPEQIMAAANAASLDFVVLADHNTLGALQDGCEGWYGSSLLLIGVEISLHCGHYLALDVPPGLGWERMDVQGTINAINSMGGFGYLAHPSSRWPWTDWSVSGYTGVEMCNVVSLIDREMRRRPLSLLLDGARDGLKSFRRGLRRTLSRGMDPSTVTWARMLREQRCLGIGGTDAHGHFELGPLRLDIPSYLEMFETVQVYITVPRAFSGELPHDKALVYDALRGGHFYTVYALWGNAYGFGFRAVSGGNEALSGGEIGRDQDGVSLEIAMPPMDGAECRVFRADEPILSASGPNVALKVQEPGAYRVELAALVDGRQAPWVFSNPIYVL